MPLRHARAEILYPLPFRIHSYRFDTYIPDTLSCIALVSAVALPSSPRTPGKEGGTAASFSPQFSCSAAFTHGA